MSVLFIDFFETLRYCVITATRPFAYQNLFSHVHTSLELIQN